MRRRALVSALGTAALAGCGSLSGSTDAAFVAPREALVDERLAIELRGLPGSRRVRIGARARGQYRRWSASATFLSSTDGTVSLAEDAPASGAYDGVDPMGLFWAMTPDVEPTEAFFPPRSHEASLTASVDGRTVAETTIRRRLAIDGVTSESAGEGLVGTIWTPPGDDPAPGVVLLHGSRPGELTAHAKLLASHGFVALALQYFGSEGPYPDVLSAVPVEYARRAVDRLLDHERVAGPQVGVWGVSKGGELALLLGSHDRRVGAVVGTAPSSLVWEGFDRRGYPTGTSSWTVDGEPVPYLEYADYDAVSDASDPFDRPRSFYEYSQLQADPADIAAATIPVERIDGPVLLVSGTDDRLWHSTPMSNRAVDRLAEHGFPYRYDHLAVDGAGHWIRLPYLPTYGLSDSSRYPLGGAPEPNARASRRQWAEALAVLAGLGGPGVDPDTATAEPRHEPEGDSTSDDVEPLATGAVAAALVAGVVGFGAYLRRAGGDSAEGSTTGDGHAALVRFLRNPSGHAAFGVLVLVLGLYAASVGRDGIGLLLGAFAFIVITDGFATHAWDRLESYYDRKAQDGGDGGGPDRALTPHRPSQTTKIAVVLGTVLFGIYLLFAAVVLLVG